MLSSENYSIYFFFLREKTHQNKKYDRNLKKIDLKLTKTPSRPVEHIHTDFDKKHFLIILDAFSKFGRDYFLETKNILNIMETLLSFVSHMGIPNKITLDNGTELNKNSASSTLNYTSQPRITQILIPLLKDSMQHTTPLIQQQK